VRAVRHDLGRPAVREALEDILAARRIPRSGEVVAVVAGMAMQGLPAVSEGLPKALAAVAARLR
jgi:hypothetical protein